MAIENGMREQELLDAFRAIVVAHAGVVDEHVFWLTKAPDWPVPRRPYIAMKFMPPEAPIRAADDRNFKTKPYYRASVGTAFTGTDYTITISDVVYTHTAGFEGPTSIRNALIALINGDPTATATATASGITLAQIEIEGKLSGVNVPVSVSLTAPDMTLVRYRSSRASQIFRAVTSTIEVSVWGKFAAKPPAIPLADDMAAAHVSKLLGALMHKEVTEPMRRLGHIPKLVTSMPDLSAVLRDEAEDTARLDVEVESTLYHTVIGEWTTEAPVFNLSPQLP